MLSISNSGSSSSDVSHGSAAGWMESGWGSWETLGLTVRVKICDVDDVVFSEIGG